MPLFESAIGGVAVSVIEQAVKGGQYVVNEATKSYRETQDCQKLLSASQAYEDNYRKRYCQIKIMPGLMKEPLDLDSIYTDVKLLNDESISSFAGAQELEEAYRAKGTRKFGFENAERIDGIDIADKEQFLTVLGGPGIGKSTFLRKIGLESFSKEKKIARKCIPVFLELKNFKSESIDIEREIIKEFALCKFPMAEAFVKSALAQGKLLILFDGLDEVPSNNINGFWGMVRTPNKKSLCEVLEL